LLGPRTTKHGLIDQSSDACMRHVLLHTASIVNRVRVFGVDPSTGRRADSEVSGSGTPMKWGKHHFILSAAHVFEKAEPKDLRVFAYTKLPATYIPRESLTPADIVDGVALTDGSKIYRCGWEDLAVVTIDADQFPNVDFIEPETSWIDPAVGEPVHCCGFPTDHSFRVNHRVVSPSRDGVDVAVWPTTFSSPVLPLPSPDEVKFYYDDLDSSRHYLMPYDEVGVSKHPGGVSGAAVWWESDKKETIWRANFRFAGTATHCHKKSSIVRVVKASVVRRFLSELFDGT
jgi:hypothetical protein